MFAYPTAAQLQKLLTEQYDCSTAPSMDQLEEAATKLAEQVRTDIFSHQLRRARTASTYAFRCCFAVCELRICYCMTIVQ